MSRLPWTARITLVSLLSLVACSENDSVNLSAADELALFAAVDVELFVVPTINALSALPGRLAKNGTPVSGKQGGLTGCTELAFCEEGVSESCNEGLHFAQCSVEHVTLDGIVPHSEVSPDCEEMVFGDIQVASEPDDVYQVWNGTLTVCASSPPESAAPFYISQTADPSFVLELEFNGEDVVAFTATSIDNDAMVECTATLSTGSVSC